jgi:hypothetical protein
MLASTAAFVVGVAVVDLGVTTGFTEVVDTLSSL